MATAGSESGMTMTRCYDILVIGGGINGTSIARAAALAGHSVMLVEQGDLAQATSSASTKLMHGGLRYLERYEFKLVRESLRERAIMLRTAPHLVRPLEFHLPHDPAIRPWFMVRAGLLLYDLLALDGNLPRSRALRLNDSGVQSHGRRGFAYWDGWADDARLVVLNALDAAEAGATVLTRTRFENAHPAEGGWRVELSRQGEAVLAVEARVIVNAAGPWVTHVLNGGFGRADAAGVRLVRGSHIVLRRKMAQDCAYLLQQADGRVVFAIPYEGDFTLIGTTDVPAENPEDDAASTDEIAYLLAVANGHFTCSVGTSDIVWHYAGIRALYDDGAADPSHVTRDYRLELCDSGPGKLLSVYGGKLTTARHLAQVALGKLGMEAADTSTRVLPGGDTGDFARFLADVRRRWPYLDVACSARMARAYGTRMAAILGDVASISGMGDDFGAGLTRVEVDYLVRVEWARSVDDILWRRTKLGLRLSPEQVARLSDYLAGTTA